ncbi:MAG TPA: potassium transporter Kup, partial [Gemmatimonadaceae bacterium]|nr:potassium transporter Kup [Gemmatimonadaceae bacterium]
TALGVVFGDIGTSPLYALRECFSPHYGLALTGDNVRGVLSLIVWVLILVVSVKYVVFILRADNCGEGGVMALLALLLQRQHRITERRRRAVFIALGLFGSALLYGDGMITPAISVLSATEGLAVATPALDPLVLPLTLAILVLFFWFQHRGTARVGAVFGPVMVVWFASIALLGAMELARTPAILTAANPWYAVRFFVDHPMRSFVVLGAVVLVITGGEALYADMGHFGKRPIRIAWFGLVLPALLLNYFGQGALLIRDPGAIANPFYLLAPAPLVMPMVGIATLAAIVASQALISGAFSLTQQCMQLGFSPRLTLVHTSARERGQIYIREVNKVIAIGTILLVLGFGSSSALGFAYGVAVTGTMAITSVLFYFVTRTWWGWPRAKALAFLIPFLAIDLTFFASNLLKVPHGGWVPLTIAGAIFVLMSTWREGRQIVSGLLRRGSLPMDLFLEDVERRKPVRVPGTAVFMTSLPEGAPVVLLHHLKHNKVLHEKVLLLTVVTAEVPEIPPAESVHVESLGEGIHRVRATYGFMQTPDIQDILARCRDAGLDPGRPMETSYYLGRERLVPAGESRMARWRKKLFVVMSRNAQSAGAFFGLPANRVVELGAVIEF